MTPKATFFGVLLGSKHRYEYCSDGSQVPKCSDSRNLATVRLCVDVRSSVRLSVRVVIPARRSRDCVVALRVYRRDLAGTIKWSVQRSVWSVCPTSYNAP